MIRKVSCKPHGLFSGVYKSGIQALQKAARP